MNIFQPKRDCLFVSPSAKPFLAAMLVRLNELKITVSTVTHEAINTTPRSGNHQLLVIHFDQADSTRISRDKLLSHSGQTYVVATPDDDVAALMDTMPAKALLVLFVSKASPSNLIDALGQIRWQANAENISIVLFDDIGGRYALPANKPVAIRKPGQTLGQMGASCADMIDRLLFRNMALDDAISKLDQYSNEQKSDLLHALKGIPKVAGTEYYYPSEVARYFDVIDRHALPLSAVWICLPKGTGTDGLIACCGQIRRRVRDVDALFLSNAGELCILLPIHRLEDAGGVADRLRQTLKSIYPENAITPTHVYASSLAKTDRLAMQKRLDNEAKAA